MECLPLSKCKPLFYWLLILMMIAIFVVRRVHGGCTKEERKALLEIKASLNPLVSAADYLPTWVDDGSSGGGAECCDWERVNCNTTTRHVTGLSLRNLRGLADGRYYDDDEKEIWPLNVSLFLHFKELRSLNLSWNHLDTGLESLSSLKKLEILDLSYNFIENGIFPSLGALTSLRILDLSYNGFQGYLRFHEFAAFKNLEILDLTDCGRYGTLQMQGFDRFPVLRKLTTLNLGYNGVNESFITSLSAFPSLKALDLSGNQLSGSFPAQGTMSRLVHLNLDQNNFSKDVMRSLAAFPSLRFLSLQYTDMGVLSAEELPNLPDLEVLLLSNNSFHGTLPLEALAFFHRLEVLDLSENNFVGNIPSAIRALSSLRVVSFARNQLNGTLPDQDFCELKNLHELDLSHNMFEGNLSQCFNSLSSLKMFDISSNRFTGRVLLPSLIANLTSLDYIDFSHNKFEVETEETVGLIPIFQLKFLGLSNCNVNKRTGSVVPGFLLHQHKLEVLDLSHNSLVGQLPLWLIENNTVLGSLNLRNNSFCGSIRMPLSGNAWMTELDMSGNHINGTIPDNIQKFLPSLMHLNLSGNALSGALPSSLCDLSQLYILDLSDNDFSGEVPKELFSNCHSLMVLKLSKNRLRGQVLSGNVSLGNLGTFLLDSNNFTGKIGNEISKNHFLRTLDISNNLFSGVLPGWMSNGNYDYGTLVVRNNSFEGRFPCGTASFWFLDISQNAFSGSIPSCLNLKYMKHLHLGSNKFTGSIPQYFRNLTNVLTLDMGNNSLSGGIPKFLGELSNLRILILRKNNFNGSIPEELCQVSNVSLIDLSGNSLSGSIPSCLQNITGPAQFAFYENADSFHILFEYGYVSVLQREFITNEIDGLLGTQDEVQFTTKSMARPYKGHILDYMSGLDLSCNKLTGEIPEELGSLTQILALNLSHNKLTGSIPAQFSTLANIESLDLSSNNLSGKVPSQLSKLHYLSTFVVANNNLSGRLPEMIGQFSTFTNKSYEGNPLLCGPPLTKKCTSPMTAPLAEEDADAWYDMDMAWFYGSFSSAWGMFLLGFAAVLYTNPDWRRRWLDLIEDCMYACYFFCRGLVRKISMLLYK